MTEYPSPAATPPVAGSLTGRTVGRFVVGNRLGKGGMGEVYRAEDTRLKRTVALKRLSPYLRSDTVYRRRFQEEVERASRFSDAHVAAVYDVIEENNEMFLVMEFVEGVTLRQRLHQPMSLEQFLDIAVQCAEALIAAHGRGIVHCDIKPENIMITTAGQVKILDFGVAKHLPRSDQSSTVDRSGTVGGTPAYMSPEVLLEKTPDGRADIFSLGIVLYEALAGHHPFLSDSYVATTHRILHEKPTPIHLFNPKVSEELERVVSRALAKDPAERYASAHDLLDDLHAVQPGVTPSKLLPRPLLHSARQTRRRIWAALTALVILAGAYGIYRWKHRPIVFRERGWALISDFDSSGEEPVPDKGVREGLTIALQQSPYVNVFPRTRAYEALQRMKRTDVSRIDEVLGREICRRENLQVLLTGSIEHLGSAFQITVRAVDPETGNLLFAEKQRFNKKDEFFDRVDKLARSVRGDLGESIARIEKTSRPLAKVTTSSMDALQLYSEASDFMAQGKSEPVPALLQGALQLDPDFAMAHLLTARLYEIAGNRAQELQHLQRAYDLRGELTDREQRLIEAGYYSERGEYEKQLQSLRVLVDLYPDDLQAHQDLSDAYRNVGNLAQAIEQLRRVVKLDPNSIQGYSDLVRFLAEQNHDDEAILTYQEALRHGWDSPGLRWGLGLALFGRGNVAQAREEFQRLRKAGGAFESIGRIYVARTDAYEGKLASSAQQLRGGVESDRNSNNVSPELLQHYLLGSIYLSEGQPGLARTELRTILAAGGGKAADPGDLVRVGMLSARIGDIASAQTASQRLQDLQAALPTSFTKACSHIVDGEIALAQGRLPLALQLLSTAAQEYPMVLSHQSLARVYQAQNDWTKAISEWQQVLDSRGEILQHHSPLDWVMAHVEIARAYSKINDFSPAQQHYQEFLEVWKDADPLPIRKQALREEQAVKARALLPVRRDVSAKSVGK